MPLSLLPASCEALALGSLGREADGFHPDSISSSAISSACPPSAGISIGGLRGPIELSLVLGMLEGESASVSRLPGVIG
eukprot:2172898-Pyramimonas_sp.AAC.1